MGLVLRGMDNFPSELFLVLWGAPSCGEQMRVRLRRTIDASTGAIEHCEFARMRVDSTPALGQAATEEAPLFPLAGSAPVGGCFSRCQRAVRQLSAASSQLPVAGCKSWTGCNYLKAALVLGDHYTITYTDVNQHGHVVMHCRKSPG